MTTETSAKTKEITLITGNQNKADLLAKYLGFPLRHVKLNLDEIQSLDLRKIVEHKVRQAYEKMQAPVLVEDTSLEFAALGMLPGPFIRFFMEEMSLETLASLLDGKTRKATARSTFGYYDGTGEVIFFEGQMNGEIAYAPIGDNGWHWSKLFIAEGRTVTCAQLDDVEYGKVMLQFRPLAKLKAFFEREDI